MLRSYRCADRRSLPYGSHGHVCCSEQPEMRGMMQEAQQLIQQDPTQASDVSALLLLSFL